MLNENKDFANISKKRLMKSLAMFRDPNGCKFNEIQMPVFKWIR